MGNAQKVTGAVVDNNQFASLKEYAAILYIEQERTVEDILPKVQAIDPSIVRFTVEDWVFADKWNERRKKFKEDNKRAVAKEVKEVLNAKNVEALDELITIGTGEFKDTKTAAMLNALCSAIKLKDELQNRSIVGEKHNNISVMLASFNQMNIGKQ